MSKITFVPVHCQLCLFSSMCHISLQITGVGCVFDSLQKCFCSTSVRYWIGLNNPNQPGCSNCTREPFSGSCGSLGDSVSFPYQCCSCRASWTWIDGEEISLDSFMNWYPDEPTGNHPTARLRRQDSFGLKWFDGPQAILYNYICKRPLAVSTEPPLDSTTQDNRATTPQTGSSNEHSGDDPSNGEATINS